MGRMFMYLYLFWDFAGVETTAFHNRSGGLDASKPPPFVTGFVVSERYFKDFFWDTRSFLCLCWEPPPFKTGLVRPRHHITTPFRCRKGGLLLTSALGVLASLLLGFARTAKSHEMLFAGRFLVGVSSGKYANGHGVESSKLQLNFGICRYQSRIFW